MLKQKNNSYWQETFLEILPALVFLSAFLLVSEDSPGFFSWLLQSFTKGFVFLLLGPFLYIKYVLKKDFRHFGFNLKNSGQGIFWGFFSLVFLLVLFYILIRFLNFSAHYQPNILATFTFRSFLFYQLILVAIPFFFQEYFFHGFLLNVLSKRFFFWSIPIQALALLATTSLVNEISGIWQVAPILSFSLVGGWLGYKTKTFVYSFALGMTFNIILDAYLISTKI